MVTGSNAEGSVPMLPLGGFASSGAEVWAGLMNACLDLAWLPDGLPQGQITIEGMAEQAALTAMSTGASRFDVIGVSFGGAVAQQMALDFPHAVRRVILVSTSVGGMAAMPNPFDPRTALAASRLWRDALFGNRYGRVGLFEIRRRSRAILGFNSQDWANQITQPTLVVHGDADYVVPYEPNARLLTRLIPRAEHHRVAGGTHYALMERVEEIAGAVSEFALRSENVLTG